MAIDNLNFYSNWLPAGQLTDKYSSQPWCLRSKNLDIFSSSKSVKATAWSQPTNISTSGVVLEDETGNLQLKSDWNVYDLSTWEAVLVYSWVETNFPAYKISYNWREGTYGDAQWWTPKQLISKYENWALKYFTIFTDRSRFSYSSLEYVIKDSDLTFTGHTGWTATSENISFTKSWNQQNSTFLIEIGNVQWFSTATLRVRADNPDYETQWHLSISEIKLYKQKYRYNDETETVERALADTSVAVTVTDQPDEATTKMAKIPVPIIPDPDNYILSVKVTITPPEWSTDYTWSSWELTIDFWGYNFYYNYLWVDNDRQLVPVWEYYWEKWDTTQTFYGWEEERTWDDNMRRVVRYYLTKYMAWINDINMDVIWMVSRNESVYMVWNMNGNGYITPCDLTWGRGTAFIAYWCTFLWVTNIDYLMYLVWHDRGVSQLWAYNWQELVAILWGSEEKDTKNLVDNSEQYKFDWKMVEYRKDLILATSDNRIFAYWQTYWGKWGTFIHQLPWTITKMVSKGKDLVVEYEASSTKYITTLQDDTPIKRYNTEWMAEYPIVLGNHLLEKEESDLYASYILPNSSCKLEFWGMANHYHFRTFKSSDNYTFDTTKSYKMKGCTGTYSLKYIEKNWDEYTFRLEGDLPIQNGNDMKITDTEWTELITYTEYNHFRKIGEITTEGYQEWEFRFHNLNNKLELPKSHSLQIMVKGKGTAQYTPELFALDLVANQRDRW